MPAESTLVEVGGLAVGSIIVSTPEQPLSALVELLSLEQIDRDIFRAAYPGEGNGRLFGGQVASQALRAAAGTIDVDHQVNSLHAYFLRPGRFGTRVVFTVDRIRDGRSFSTRRVVALQDGEAIMNLDASFHAAEEGEVFQGASPVHLVPSPDELPRDPDRRGPHQHPIDSRSVSFPDSVQGARARWARTADPLPDDPVLHACAITYLSDSGPVGATRHALGSDDDQPAKGRMMTASLDHCVWFHRPVRADDWLLYRLEAVACGAARGLARGEMWTPEGELVVSVSQESLLRLRSD